jgi:hypothetical protein
MLHDSKPGFCISSFLNRVTCQILSLYFIAALSKINSTNYGFLEKIAFPMQPLKRDILQQMVLQKDFLLHLH